MNASTEFAQETTGKVTAKTLLDVLRKGGAFCNAHLHGRATNGRESYSDSFIFDFSVPVEAKDGVKVTHKLSVPGYVSNGHTSTISTATYHGHNEKRYCETYRPETGFWSLMGASQRLLDVLELLPANAEIAFNVALDHMTNPLCVEAGLHGDALFLVASHTTRGKRHNYRILVDTAIGQHNSARFGNPRG